MKTSDVWKAALIRLGATEKSADEVIAGIVALAKSREAFDRWNDRLPDQAARPLIRGIAEPGGEKLAREILENFRSVMMKRFGATESDVAQYFGPFGLN